MGNCASSKYAVDEDKAPKKQKNSKKQKKEIEANGVTQEAAPIIADSPSVNVPVAEPEIEADKPEKEDIGFIDESTQQNESPAKSTTVTETKSDENQKKEVTTYQTTVVKHSQKEGDELMNHLKTEAFRTLQNFLKKQDDKSEPQATTTVTTTTASSNNEAPENAQACESEDIVAEIKAQALVSLGSSKQDEVFAIIDVGAEMIKNGTVKDMNELLASLESKFPNDKELVSKVMNSTTGFLTAKGTEAGSLLSNILANVSTGLQGVMNETEKTTVKVTRTVTEQIMSGGQMTEVTRVITSDQPMPGAKSDTIEDVLENLRNGLSVDGTVFTTSTTMAGPPEITRTKVVQSGTTESSTSHSEKTENVHESSVTETQSEDSVTRSQAEKVVSTAVNGAVEKLNAESCETGVIKTEESDIHEHCTEENIKIEEERSIKASTTRIILNGEETVTSQIERAQNEFYKHGKQEAEQSINKLVVNGEETVTKSSAESKSEKEENKSDKTVENSETVVAAST